MSLSSLIVRWLVLAAVGAALLAFGALQGARWQENVDGVQLARLQAAGDRERAAAALKTQRAEAAARAEESRRQKEKDDAIEEAQARAARAADDLRRADHVAGELRDQLAYFVARAREAAGNPAAGGGSAPAAAALDLLADLSGRIDAAAGDLARFAEAAHGAGLACQQQYDSLTPKE